MGGRLFFAAALAICAPSLLTSRSASADLLHLDFAHLYEFETSPSLPTAGNSWLTAEFEDTATDTVRLTLTSFLVDSEAFGKVLFNLAEGIEVDEVSYLSGHDFATWGSGSGNAPANTGPWELMIKYGEDDSRLWFGSEAETSVLELSGIGLTASSFFYTNGNYPPLYGMAHIQSIGQGDDSAWLGSVVPIPAPALIAASGLIVIGAVRRRR